MDVTLISMSVLCLSSSAEAFYHQYSPSADCPPCIIVPFAFSTHHIYCAITSSFPHANHYSYIHNTVLITMSSEFYRVSRHTVALHCMIHYPVIIFMISNRVRVAARQCKIRELKGREPEWTNPQIEDGKLPKMPRNQSTYLLGKDVKFWNSSFWNT